MKKKKIIISANYLDRKPLRHPDIAWKADENGKVTLEIENTGWANRIAQKLFGRPKVSFVHFDENGSFIWPLIDGNKNITEIGTEVKAHFGESCEPLYERLAQFFRVLDSYHFILWKYIPPEPDNKKAKKNK